MSARKTSTVRLLMVVVGLSLIFIASAAAQQAGQPRQNAKDEVGQKLVEFEMRDKPWKDVLEWLADNSGLPVFSDVKPTGTFTYIAPRTAPGAKPEKKTISEVVDDLNAALRTKKFLIVRLNNAFTVVPADEKVPASEVQRLPSVDDLYKHANSELVSMYYPLKVLNADEFAVQVKKMMGSFGEVYPISTTNTLFMQDEVATLKQIVAMIKECENLETRPGDTLSYKCEYIAARDAEKVLKSFLGDPAKSPPEGTAPVVMMPGGMNMPGVPNFQMMTGGDGNFDPRQFRGRGQGRGGNRGGPGGADNSPGIKAVVQAITSDEQTNTVFVRGPADKLAQAREILKKIDVGTEKFVNGPAIMRTYTIPSGNAEAVAAMLTQNYKNSDLIKIAALGNSQILVYAPPQDHFRIAKDLETSKPSGGAVKIPLNNTDANRIVETLTKIYSSADGKVGYPYFEADGADNTIIVKGSSEQISEVRDIIKVLSDQPALGIGAAGSSNLRVITLEKGNAAALADALQKAMGQLRQNPVNVFTPDTKPAATPPKDKDVKEIKKDGGEEQDDPKGQQQNQLFDPQKKNDPKNDQKPGDKKAPITITAVGNRLIISSDDPAAIALAQELIRIYTQAPKGDTGFEIIRLKNAKAVDAAKILDDAFNGPKQTMMPGGGGIPGFGGGFGGGRGGGGGGFLQALMAQQQSSQNPAKPRIRVVADAATNSLLVQASPLDMLEIRHLLDKAIDSDDTDSNAVIKTWPPITLKYADATEVAGTLQSVYREYMNAGATSGFQSFGPAGLVVGGRSRGGAVDANGNLRTVSLTFGVDTRSNSIILQCSESMFKDVKKLIDQLDASAKDSNKTIKLVQIKGVDPLLVQQALDLIQGRRSTVNAGGMMGMGQQGGFAGQQGGGGFQGGQRAGFAGGGQGFGGGGQGFGGGGQGFGGGGQGFGGGGQGFGGGGLGLGGGGRGGFGGGGQGFGGGGQGFGGGGRGGAGGGRGGQQRSPGGAPDGGPDFFEHRVMEDPRSLSLYDPRLDNSPTTDDMIRALAVGRAPESLTAELLAVAAGEQQPQTQPGAPSTSSQDVPAPRRPVTADVLSELGYIIITAENPADVQAIEKIIQIIISTSKGAEVTYEIVPLKFADATSVTTTLNQVFSRVSVNSTNSGRILPGQAQTNISTPGGNISAAQNIPSQNLVLLPLIRFNAIFVAAPEARMQDVKKRIAELDKPTAEVSRAVPFGLKNASAKNVATIVNNFYAARGESQNVNQIRITEDDTTNTILVQAAPADMEDIRRLIEHLDSTPTSAVNDLRIYRLKIALADELSNLLTSALAQGVVTTGTTGTTTGAGILGAGAGGGVGGLGGGGLGGGGLGGFAGGAGGGFAGAAARPATGGIGGTTAISGQGGTATSRNTGLRFVFGPNNWVEGLFLQDIHITPDLRTNSIIISAPKQTMPMLFKLLEELDVAPTARAEIKVFPLKKADAVTLETILQNLFFGTTNTVPGSGTIANGPAGATSATGAAAAAVPPTAATGAAGLTGSGALGQTGPVPRALVQIPGLTPEGVPLVELHITADPRTNSLIVAGGRNELLVIEAIILKLEDTPIMERQDQVVHLQNASAADVATVLQNYIVQTIQPYVRASQNNALQDLEREIVVIAEPFTNKLLVSATPQYFAKLMRLIQELDAKPLQVVIQVMICEVDLTSTEEFGVEIGLQSPVLFQRGIYPNLQSGFGSSTAISFSQPGYSALATSPIVSPGVFVPTASASGTQNPFAVPGFNFNASPGLPALGNNPLAAPGVVGSQGVSNLGVGRANANGLSGFVFSAASDSFNLLVRALKTQGRVDILSRPQVMTLDNQTATINIGQQIPYLSSTTLSANGLSQQSIDRVIVGVNLTVTPRISPDGTVLMRVTPSVSSVAPNQENLGNGLFSPIFNVQQVDTTVQAMDGETVAIGGLITKNENKQENKIPVLGDLPFLGVLFRYRTQNRQKTELLVIMTPHVVRSKADADRVLGEEARRMDWIMGDVLRTHGTYGMEPIIPRKDPVGGPGAGNPNCPAPIGDLEGPPPVVLPPQTTEPLTQPRIAPQAVPETMPPARPPVRPDQPQASVPMQSLQPVGTQASFSQGVMDRGAPEPMPTNGTLYQQQAQAMPEPTAKQPSRWNPFNRGQ